MKEVGYVQLTQYKLTFSIAFIDFLFLCIIGKDKQSAFDRMETAVPGRILEQILVTLSMLIVLFSMMKII